ncbi:glycosyltransferase family 2 protein [Sulfitobacter sp. 1A15299]|uniref:glycosyltransferase family 2 protein n=1 Tax=Sulfitobacter sp. 1A15299 TaxID=3368598 RepID=UPI00374666CE
MKTQRKSEPPKISVLIPCYNCEDTVDRAICSVMNNSYMPYEILAYDDCSSDGTLQVLRRLEEDIGCLKVFSGTENEGAGYSRTFLINRARGGYIAFLDADDWWYEKKLQKQVDVITELGADIVTSYYDVVRNQENIGIRKPLRVINYFTLHLANWLPTSMTVFRSSLDSAGQMPTIRRRQDYGFWLTIFRQNRGLKCVVVPEALGAYSKTAGSLSSGRLTNLKYNYLMFRDVMSYGRIFSVALVMFNSITRLIR